MVREYNGLMKCINSGYDYILKKEKALPVRGRKLTEEGGNTYEEGIMVVNTKFSHPLVLVNIMILL